MKTGEPLLGSTLHTTVDPSRPTEQHDRAGGNLDRNGVHFLTAYVAGV